MADFFSVQDISLCLGGRQILDHVSFSVDTPGRVIGLLGPNGGGKTTLLRSICGELPHDGHVFLEGAELAGLRSKELARRVSYIPQQSGISISMSAIDVVLMGFYPKLKLLSQPSADMRAAALRALEQVGMAGLADRDYLTLSGGEKQLVILARTLVEDMESVHGRPGKAGLICLHDPVLALACCDTLMLLKDGRLICTLQPKTDSVQDMEKAFSEIYGAVRLVAVADPEISNHKRLILLPLL